ncbi:MAG: amidohydrolase family protein [Candidatus Lokiarchaeia archaeon]
MDILIKNGRVVDGTGNPWFHREIGIENGKIKEMAGEIKDKADVTIDAGGLIVAPGFIDAHSHVDGIALFKPDMEFYVTQGVTTGAMGHCGYSPHPSKKAYVDQLYSSPWSMVWWLQTVSGSDLDWNSLTEYFDIIRKNGVAVNLAPFIGHGTMRQAVGLDMVRRDQVRKPTKEEIEAMKDLTRKGMQEGALGLTISLGYPPNRYAETDEMVELARIVAEYDGLLAVHLRKVCGVENIKELADIAKKAGVKFHAAHLQIVPPYVDTLTDQLSIIDSLRSQGQEITFDVVQYPTAPLSKAAFTYAFWFISTVYDPNPPEGTDTYEKYVENLKDPAFRDAIKQSIIKYVPDAADYFEYIDSDLEMSPIYNTQNPEIESRTLGDVAMAQGMKAIDLFFDIVFGQSPLVPEAANPVFGIAVMGTQEFIEKATAHPVATPSMDLAPPELPPEMTPWPNSYGFMAKYFRDAVERGVTVEEAVRKMTSLPAQNFRLFDRGLLREGMAADIVIFDPMSFKNISNIYNPYAKAVGMRYVIVNGKVALEEGKQTEERAGQILLKKKAA